MKIYRGSDSDDAPFEMECEVFGYPHRTTCGQKMYVNTHFRTREEAWKSIRQSAEAGINLTAARLEEARTHVRHCERMAAEAAVRMARVLSVLRGEGKDA